MAIVNWLYLLQYPIYLTSGGGLLVYPAYEIESKLDHHPTFVSAPISPIPNHPLPSLENIDCFSITPLTNKFAQEGPYLYTLCMNSTKIGYARSSTDSQDLAFQKQALETLGVAPDRVYTYHGRTDTNRARPRSACAKGKLGSKQPKLSQKQQCELTRMHTTEACLISNLAKIFSVSSSPVYRMLQRAKGKSSGT